MAVDVFLILGLLHSVTDEGAKGAHSVTVLVQLQLIRGDAREALMAVTTRQGQLWDGHGS
jgi:hypothetical protein